MSKILTTFTMLINQQPLTTMKSLILVLAFSLVFVSCKKDEEPTPNRRQQTNCETLRRDSSLVELTLTDTNLTQENYEHWTEVLDSIKVEMQTFGCN